MCSPVRPSCARAKRPKETAKPEVNPQSFLRARKKAAMPPVFLTLSLGLPAPIESPRLDGAVEPYPGRWTNHIVVASVEEIDSELLGWASEARFFAELKGR